MDSESTSSGSNDVAIVGIGLRFPGALDAAKFWSNLRSGVVSGQDFAESELAARGVPARLLHHPAYVRRGYPLEDFDHFDAEFFGFSPKDASILDPQHRQFLECAWEALEDAGHPPESIHGPVGVFAGCGMGSYLWSNVLTNPALVESVGMFLLRHTGNDKDFLTTRVSYCLDLRGPSVNVQTACSTSLVATHLAVQSLLSGECDVALAGGVTIDLPHGVGYLYRENEILAPDGRCCAFSDRSRGTVFGSGVGVVALRRLEDALRDGDRVYAVIKGSAVNNDGASKVSYLAPSVDGQAAAVAEALAAADVDAGTIEMLEAHGTGTPIGEPIEVAAMTQAFSRSTSRRQYCGVGSVKANIGHLDTAAGVASLIKAALALHHGEIPPLPEFTAPNPAIPFASSPFYVVDQLRPWPRRGTPRRAAVNSLGVGGTNAFVILEEAPEPPLSSASRLDWQLLALSARTPKALDDASRRLAEHLRAHPSLPLADVAFTLMNGRRAFPQRRVLVTCSREDAAAQLEKPGSPTVHSHVAGSTAASVAWLLPGGGTQHVRMGLDLYDAEPLFRDAVDHGIDELRKRTGRDLRPCWIEPADDAEAAAALQRPSLQLPAIFILEHALAQFWASLGVHADALIGHSMGENTAACLAGVLSFEDALGLVALRGELFEQLPDGAMLSVPVALDELVPWIGADLDIAAVNSPSVTVVSGSVGALEDLERRLVEGGVEARRIPITTAAHSRLVDPILPRFLEYLRGIPLHAPRIPFLSNATGTWITAEQATSPEYWARHLRGTVRFSDGVRQLLSDPARVLLEVGPGKSLSSLVRHHPDASGVRGVLASMRHPDEKVSDVASFLTAFGRLWACGAKVDTGFLWRGEQRRRVTLPAYPFQHRRHWIDAGKPVDFTAPASSSEPKHIDLLTEGAWRPAWKPAPRVAAPPAARAREWLLFLDQAGLGDRLAAKLRARGDTVITVREGDVTRRVSDSEFTLAPERGREGYDELVRDLLAAGRAPKRIVHLWTVTPDESFRPGSNFFHRNQERGFYSLLFLAQALGEEGVKGPLHLTVVSNGLQSVAGEPLLHPAKATLLGPCKVIPRELAGFTCSSVDVPVPVGRSFRRRQAAARLDAIAAQLESEVFSAPANAVVAWRDGVRHEQVFERMELSPAGSNGHSPVRERGVYLVTGGLGGVGLLVAADLAQRAHARLVLVGRSSLPERSRWDAWVERRGKDEPTSRRIRAVKKLEAAGAEVFVACADVADVDAMRRVIDETKRRFGGLDGVIHAAGVLRDGPLLAKTQQQIEEVFASKVHGTLVLDALLKDADLDFLLLFSSVSGIVAPGGQADYVGASAFLDAYAQSARTAKPARSGRKRRTIAVDWGIWAEVGMAANALRVATAPPSASAGPAPRHPLFDSRGADPDAPLTLRARYTPSTYWVLDEHRTRDGRSVLPGAAYVELARAALAETGENPNFEVRDLLLLRPLHIGDDETREVHLELQPNPEGYHFQVRSRVAAPANPGGNGRAEAVAAAANDAAADLAANVDESWEMHAQARLVMRTPPIPPKLGLRDIERRCSIAALAPGRDTLLGIQEQHVRFGPRWRTLRELRLGQGEVLATVELPAEFASDLEEYAIHPALLDIAMTCALELPELCHDPRQHDCLWVPVSFRSVRVHAPLPAKLRSWVRSRRTNRTDDPMLAFDVVLADVDGRVCLEIEDFVMRRTAVELGLADGRKPDAPAPAAGTPPPAPRREARPVSPHVAALRRNFEQGIVPAEGLEAMQRILGTADVPQVVATSLDLDGLREQAEQLTASLEVWQDEEPEPDDDPEPDDALGAADGIERTLTGFWKELLGVRKVGLRDSFFDLGGHSLIAVRLFAKIKKTWDVEFPISLLFEAPTIERCAAVIRAAVKPEQRSAASAAAPSDSASTASSPAPSAPKIRYTHVVPMHPGQGGAKTPFFLVAGMFGNVLNLRHLAHLFGNERRFYGLQAQGLLGGQKPHETFEEMAEAYLAELRDVQPHGPYLLGGFSGGGITAFEMSRRLVADGEEVALLAMLDTGLPKQPRLHTDERVRIHWQRLCRRGPAYFADWARDKMRWRREQRRRRRHGANGAATTPTEFRSEEIGAAFRRALGRYEMRAYPGIVTLFRPKLEIAHVLGPGRVTNSRREFVFPDNGWGVWASRVDVHEVPGDHDSMVLEPNVRVLSAKLRKCIQEVESASLHPALARRTHGARA
jgi:acyl transferase domain-containing protein/thioesterase domain-containing protein